MARGEMKKTPPESTDKQAPKSEARTHMHGDLKGAGHEEKRPASMPEARVKTEKEAGESTQEKKEGKESAKQEKPETKKESAALKVKAPQKVPSKKRRKLEKVGRVKIQKTRALKKARKKIRQKWKPDFRGRFGKRQFRRLTKEKWSKWHHPRGIDIRREQAKGNIPSTGYRVSWEIRGLHPSGLKEFLVNNVRDVSAVPPGSAVRISAGVGRKKRVEVLKAALERKVYVVN
ncbi:MAG: hypothetical protein HY393_03220 [Candidatus Diapherotrites archaeon]|nr:hypothetical protein [Candidatus Diapherotrites archaeon]